MSQLTIPKKKSAPVPAPAVAVDLVTASTFAYGALTSDVADAAKAAAERIRALTDNAKQSCFEIGRELLTIKEKLGHGEFGKWIDAEFGISQRTAQNYMGAAKLRDECETVSVLPQKIIYAIASLPDECKAKVIAKIESAPQLPVEAIKSEIDTARTIHTIEKAQAEKLKDKTPEQIARAKKAKAKREEAEAAKAKAEDEARRQAAANAVAMLKDRLKADFPQFLELAEKASWSLTKALRDAGATNGA